MERQVFPKIPRKNARTETCVTPFGANRHRSGVRNHLAPRLAAGAALASKPCHGPRASYELRERPLKSVYIHIMYIYIYYICLYIVVGMVLGCRVFVGSGHLLVGAAKSKAFWLPYRRL